MEIVVDPEAKIVEVWLRRDEEALGDRLKPRLAEWRRQGLMPAVFLSGSRDLTHQTSALLCHNRKRLAQLAVEEEKARRPGL